MFLRKPVTLFFLFVSFSGSFSHAYNNNGQHQINIEVVMRGGDDPIEEMDFVDSPTYHDGTCLVNFPRTGNWATQNGFLTGGWDANQNSQCQSSGPNAPLMTYKLQRDGNFVAYCGSILDYSTHTGQGSVGNYFLAIDNACVLHLFKGTVTCNGVNIEEEIWTNIQFEPLRNGGRLGKGEMVRYDVPDTTLVLQSSDGNLVLYQGSSSIDTVLWAANASPPSGGTNNMHHDFYAKVTDNGYLQLVGINYQNGSEFVYFEKMLGVPAGSSCGFTVEYDYVADDLVSVAAPCS